MEDSGEEQEGEETMARHVVILPQEGKYAPSQPPPNSRSGNLGEGKGRVGNFEPNWGEVRL